MHKAILIFVFCVIGHVAARPPVQNKDSTKESLILRQLKPPSQVVLPADIVLKKTNLITAPSTRCPDGQTMVNGNCRDIFRQRRSVDSTVPEPKKIEGKSLDEPNKTKCIIACNIPECPPGQLPDGLGNCRDIW